MALRPDLNEWHRRSQALRRLPMVTQTSPEQIKQVREWAISRRKAAVYALRQAEKARTKSQRRAARRYLHEARQLDAVATGIEYALLFLFCEPGHFPRVEEDLLPPMHSRPYVHFQNWSFEDWLEGLQPARFCGAPDGPVTGQAQQTTCPACLDALAKQKKP
jgi:hypothetical protein